MSENNSSLRIDIREVGKRYLDMQTNQCVMRMDYDGSWRLTAEIPNPTDKEIQDFKIGKLQIAMADIDNKIFILLKFGGQPWCDASYEPRLNSGLFEYPQIKESSQGASLQIELYDSATGILKVLRLIGLPNELSNQLHSRCTELASMGKMSRIANDQQVSQIYNKYRETTSMLDHAQKVYIIDD